MSGGLVRMKYEYRWLYALVVLLVVMAGGYWIVLKPTWTRLIQFHKTENRLRETLNKGKQAAALVVLANPPEKNSAARTQADLLADLFMQMEGSGMAIQAATVSPLQPIEVGQGVRMMLKAQGDFSRLMRLMAVFSHYDYPVIVLDFSYETAEGASYLFTAHILILNIKKPSRMQPLSRDDWSQVMHPFCEGSYLSPTKEQTELMETRSFRAGLLSMVGYLEQGNRKQALISLPNHRVFAVTLGDSVGEEGAIITDITPDTVTALLSGHRFIRLKKRSYLHDA